MTATARRATAAPPSSDVHVATLVLATTAQAHSRLDQQRRRDRAADRRTQLAAAARHAAQSAALLAVLAATVSCWLLAFEWLGQILQVDWHSTDVPGPCGRDTIRLHNLVVVAAIAIVTSAAALHWNPGRSDSRTLVATSTAFGLFLLLKPVHGCAAEGWPSLGPRLEWTWTGYAWLPIVIAFLLPMLALALWFAQLWAWQDRFAERWP